MKLTPFGFVNRAETFAKEALSLPPRGGGEWVMRRMANFMEHTGALHILINNGQGSPKTGAVLNSRITGGPRDSGVQGWVEYPGGQMREAFVLRETDADRAMEEIFDIVEKTLGRIPEWDNSVVFERPKPPPRVFEPLLPEIQKNEPAPVAAEADTAAVSATEAAPSSEADSAEKPSDMQAFVDSLLSPDSFDGPEATPAPTAEAPAEPEQPVAEEEPPKAAKKPGRGRRIKI